MSSKLEQTHAHYINQLATNEWKPFLDELSNLPNQKVTIDKNTPEVTIKSTAPIDKSALIQIQNFIKMLAPWKKGPFKLFDHLIEGDWNSQYKWKILKTILPSSLNNKNVADIGCNNGWFLFKLMDLLPKSVVGFEPNPLFWFQFQLFNHFLQQPNTQFHPFGFEYATLYKKHFDIVLCCGIHYHHPNPLDMFETLYKSMKPGAMLIIEGMTHSITEDYPFALFSDKKDAIYWIPNQSCLINWLKRAGFTTIRHHHTDDQYKLKSWQDKDVKALQQSSPHPQCIDEIDLSNPTLDIRGFPLCSRDYFSAIAS